MEINNEQKTIARFILLLLILSLFLVTNISAQTTEKGCCKETNGGSYCQNVEQSECSGEWTGLDCDETNNQGDYPFGGDCLTYCAVNQKEELCKDGISGVEIEDSDNLVKTPDGTCNTGDCESGCCIINGAGTYTEKIECKKMSREEGVDEDFDETMGRTECKNLIKSEEKGACVLSGGNCDYGTREECNNKGGDFHSGIYCSDSSLKEQGVDCVKHDYTECYEGDVYWYDSCNNREDTSEECNDGQEICSLGNNGKPVCKDLSCDKGDLEEAGLDTSTLPSDKQGLKNGESVCYYGGRSGYGTDAVGSEHWTVTCSQGEIIKSSCGTERKGICKQAETTKANETMQKAFCVPNQATSCLGISTKYYEKMEKDMNAPEKSEARKNWESHVGPSIKELQNVSMNKEKATDEARKLCREGEGCIFNISRDPMCSDGEGGECPDPGESYEEIKEDIIELEEKEEKLRSDWAETGSPYEKKLHSFLSDMQGECSSHPSCMFSYAGYEDKANHFPLGICLPKYPRPLGTDATSEEENSDEEGNHCNDFTVTGKVVYRKTSSGRYRCVENCKLLHPKTFERMNSVCMAAGDCGLSQNIENEWSLNDLSYEPSERQLIDGNAFVRNERVGNAESISERCYGLDKCDGGYSEEEIDKMREGGNGNFLKGCVYGFGAGAAICTGVGALTEGAGFSSSQVAQESAKESAKQMSLPKDIVKDLKNPPMGSEGSEVWGGTWSSIPLIKNIKNFINSNPSSQGLATGMKRVEALDPLTLSTACAVGGCLIGGITSTISDAPEKTITKEWLKWTIQPPEGVGDDAGNTGWDDDYDGGCTAGDFGSGLGDAINIFSKHKAKNCQLDLSRAIIPEAEKTIKDFVWNEWAEIPEEKITYEAGDAIRMTYPVSFIEEVFDIDAEELTQEEINNKIRESIEDSENNLNMASLSDIESMGITNLLSEGEDFRGSYLKKRRRKERREAGGFLSSWRGSAKGNYWFGGETHVVEVEYKCNPYQPPTNADCSKCEEGPMGCTEYKCESLGTNCKAINTDTNYIQCVERENDEQGPSIEDISFAGDNSISGEGDIWEIQENVREGKEISFNITLDEPGICRYSDKSYDNYGDMPSNLPDIGEMKKEHTFSGVKIPQLATILGDDYEYGNSDANLNFSIRCIDYFGNSMQKENIIEYTAESVPDTFAPEIDEDSLNPQNEFSWPYKPEEFVLKMEVFDDNWPVDCRYSSDSGASFENMENNMSCSQGSEDICSTTLEDTSKGDHTVHIKCKDNAENPNTNDGFVYKYRIENNMNYTEYKEENGLEISSVNVEMEEEEFNNNANLSTSKDPAEVTLNVQTSQGKEEGKAVCSYKKKDNNTYNDFINTNSTTHSHTLDYLLSSGKENKNYSFSVLCDDGLTNDTQKINFSVEFDQEGPEIDYTYEAGKLAVTTDEPAKCSYYEGKCGDFDISEGNDFDFGYEYVEEQTTDWNPDWDGYSIKCTDELGNVNCERYGNVSVEGPKIIRIFKNNGQLELNTNMNAKCYYSFNDCQFSDEEKEDNLMSSDFSKSHSTEWNSGTKHYIQCKDSWDNWNDCIEVKPSSLA